VSRIIHFEIPASNPERILLWVWATSWIFATRDKWLRASGSHRVFARRTRPSVLGESPSKAVSWAQSASSHAEKQLGVPGSSQSHLAGSYKAKGTSVRME
jgi:hypothetical protein